MGIAVAGAGWAGEATWWGGRACFFLLRIADGVVTWVVGIGTWALMGPATLAGSTTFVAGRAAPAPRGVLGVESAPVTVSVDGLSANVLIPSGTVADTLRGLGLEASAADRLSSPIQAAVVPGHRVALDRGLPVTVIDGGRGVAARSVRGTVADLLDAAGIVLGPLDEVGQPLDASLNPGDVIRITASPIGGHRSRGNPSPSESSPTPNSSGCGRSWSLRASPGVSRTPTSSAVVDGREAARTLVSSQVLSVPVVEVRRVGTRTPTGAAEIEAIIREAAAAYGADPSSS